MEIGQYHSSSCSKEHQKTYQEWFAFADSDGDGRVTGPDAIKFFGMSKLSRPDLKQVWTIADSRRQGYLGFNEFVSAMQLISIAQAGNEITQDSLKRNDLSSLNPPVLEGLDAMLAKCKHLVKRADPDIDGFPQEQSPLTNKWFSSKSSKKSFAKPASK